jgi:hypothetical protein
MYLYDRVYGKETHLAAQNFLEYARQNYVGVSNDGKLEWVTLYYDPLVKWKLNAPPVTGPLTAFLLAPQQREFATLLYDAAVNAFGLRAQSATVRANTDLLLLARELGDSAVADKLQAAAERESDPRFFGKQGEMFGWWTDAPTEGYPRGQASAMLMVSEIGRPGDWGRALQAQHLDKFTAPTVEGVAFPAMGCWQAWNDPASGTLHLGTYAASSAERGAATSFKITNLPSASAVRITVDGQPFTSFEVTGPSTLRIDTTIEHRQYRIVTGYRGSDRSADESPPPGQDRSRIAGTGGLALAQRSSDGRLETDGAAGRNLFSDRTVGCACCSSQRRLS